MNFDPHILILIRETECMDKMSLEVPYAAQPFKQKTQTIFKDSYDKLQASISFGLVFKRRSASYRVYSFLWISVVHIFG